MVFLGLWFKRIILVLLLSIFLEFLLPSNVMQRYVRLVMGMVLISVIMLPIVQFLHMDVNSIEQQVLQIFQKESTPDTSLQRILNNGQQLKQLDQNQSFSEWKTQLENQLKDQLEQRFGVQVDRVTIQADVGQKQTSPVISSLDVKVNANKSGKSTSSAAEDTSLRIAPVQPIANTDASDQTQTTVQPHSVLTAQEQTMQQQMIGFLQSQLQISESLIHISFEDSVRR